MSDIKEILKNNIENFQLEYYKLDKKLEEKEEELKDSWMYAGYLKKSVKENQILFWCKGYLACADTPRYIFDYLYENFGTEYKYIWAVKSKKWIPKDVPSQVRFVFWETAEFWEALACSKYLIGNVLLPGNFIKRTEQVYVNSLLGIDSLYRTRNTVNQNAYTQVLTELLKTDYLLADSQWMIDQLYVKNYQLHQIYQGKVLLTDSVRASYMKNCPVQTLEKAQCLFLIRNKETYEWFKTHISNFQDDNMEISLVRDQNCSSEGVDICNKIAQSDLVISDRSNYLRDAAAYGCKVCCFKESQNYIGFETYKVVKDESELKEYLVQNKNFRRNNTNVADNCVKQIVEAIFYMSTGNYIKSLHQEKKKSVWFLTDWKMPREKYYLIKRALENIDTDKYDISVIAPVVTDISIQEELAKLSNDIRQMNYRGKLVLTREDTLLFQLIEKNPALILENSQINEYVSGIMEQQWRHKWGNPACDVMVLFGEKIRQYMMTVFQKDAKKILIAEEPLQAQKEKDAIKWQQFFEKFDKIYISPFGQDEKREALGEINSKKIQVQELLFAKESQDFSVQSIELSGETYIVADRWPVPPSREQMYLVKVLEQDSYVINMELHPDEKRKKWLSDFLKDKKNIVVFGKCIDAYKECGLGEYQELDRFAVEKLYMLPVAKYFFEHIKGYVGDSRLEYDVFGEICKNYKIQIQ